jgi:hypothetical protein
MVILSATAAGTVFIMPGWMIGHGARGSKEKRLPGKILSGRLLMNWIASAENPVLLPLPVWAL